MTLAKMSARNIMRKNFLWKTAILIAICKEVTSLQRKENDVSSKEINSACEYGWHHHGKYCYLLENRPMPWECAESNCLRKGANLVSIHSKEQQDFLIEHFLKGKNSNLWIGLHDTTAEGSYMWTDGSSIDYTNWNQGEPSGVNIKEDDCVELLHDARGIFYGSWNDMPCNHERTFICQKPSEIINYTNETESNAQDFSHNSTEIINYTNETESNAKDFSHNSNSVFITTFLVVTILILVIIAQLGAIFYYRKLWMQEKVLTSAPLLFTQAELQNEVSRGEPLNMHL